MNERDVTAGHVAAIDAPAPPLPSSVAPLHPACSFMSITLLFTPHYIFKSIAQCSFDLVTRQWSFLKVTEISLELLTPTYKIYKYTIPTFIFMLSRGIVYFTKLFKL